VPYAAVIWGMFLMMAQGKPQAKDTVLTGLPWILCRKLSKFD
jgi:hypothetical protein